MVAAAGGAPAGVRHALPGRLLVLAERRVGTMIPMLVEGSFIADLQERIAAVTGILVGNVEVFATDERNAPTGAALLPEAPFRADVFQHGVVYVRDAAAAGEWL